MFALTFAIANVVFALLVTLSAVSGVVPPMTPLKETFPASPAIIKVFAPLIVVVASLKLTPPPLEVVNVIVAGELARDTGPVKVMPPDWTVIAPGRLIAVAALVVKEVSACDPPTMPEKVTEPVPALIVMLRVLSDESALIVLEKMISEVVAVKTTGVPVRTTAPCRLMPVPAARFEVILASRLIVDPAAVNEPSGIRDPIAPVGVITPAPA